MHASQPIKFAIGVWGCFPLLAFAAEPATQPVVPADPAVADVSLATADADSPLNDASAGDTKPHPSDGPLPGHGRFAQRFLQPTDYDKSQAMLYLKAHSPNRYKFIQDLPDGDRKSNVTEVAARRYVRWMQMMKEDQDLFQVVFKRIEVEDQIFGLVSQLRKDPSENQHAVETKLHDQVASLVDLGIQERQLRLDRLAKTVEDQKNKLAEDRANQANLVEERLNNILAEGKNLFPDSGDGGGPHNHTSPHQGDTNRPPGQ